MKPKIKKIDGWWCCYTAWNQVGIGSSPVIAYENWKMQVRV